MSFDHSVFRVKSVRKAQTSGLSRQGVQPLISARRNARAVSAAPKAAAPLKRGVPEHGPRLQDRFRSS
jgi:hypothetical protein